MCHGTDISAQDYVSPDLLLDRNIKKFGDFLCLLLVWLITNNCIFFTDTVPKGEKNPVL